MTVFTAQHEQQMVTMRHNYNNVNLPMVVVFHHPSLMWDQDVVKVMVQDKEDMVENSDNNKD